MKNLNTDDKYNVFHKLGNSIYIPKIFTNLFRSDEELISSTNKGFDNLNTTFTLIAKKLKILNNSINENKETLDRYGNIIENKNNKIDFYAYSEQFPENGKSNQFLNKSLEVSTGNIEGFIADEDSGIEINEIIEDDKNYIKLNFDDSKLKGIKFHSASNSSIRIIWDDNIQGYKVEQNTLIVYESSEPETEIIIDHNLGTKAIDVKTFKILANDVDLRYPIVPGIEFPSDNQVRLYLTEPRIVHVLISRL